MADTTTWLTLRMPPPAIEREAIAGVMAAAAALSREICALCAGPGGPVRHIDSWLSTRCRGCTAGQRAMARGRRASPWGRRATARQDKRRRYASRVHGAGRPVVRADPEESAGRYRSARSGRYRRRLSPSCDNTVGGSVEVGDRVGAHLTMDVAESLEPTDQIAVVVSMACSTRSGETGSGHRALRRTRRRRERERPRHPEREPTRRTLVVCPRNGFTSPACTGGTYCDAYFRDGTLVTHH